MKSDKTIQQELQEIKELLATQKEKPLNLDEASKYLSLSKSYLYKLVHFKRIGYYKPNGKLIYFSKNELDRWLFRGRHKSSDELEAEAESYLSRKAGAL